MTVEENQEIVNNKNSVFDEKKQKLNSKYVFLSSFLLFSPYIMGLCINALNHEQV